MHRFDILYISRGCTIKCILRSLIFQSRISLFIIHVVLVKSICISTVQLYERDGAARTLKKMRTPKGYYGNKQRLSSIAPLFEMGTSLKGKNSLQEGANSFLKE